MRVRGMRVFGVTGSGGSFAVVKFGGTYAVVKYGTSDVVEGGFFDKDAASVAAFDWANGHSK